MNNNVAIKKIVLSGAPVVCFYNSVRYMHYFSMDSPGHSEGWSTELLGEQEFVTDFFFKITKPFDEIELVFYSLPSFCFPYRTCVILSTEVS